MMKEKQSGKYQEIEIDKIWGLSAALENIENVYEIEKTTIGTGHFGAVRRGTMKLDKRRFFAIKTIKKKKLKNDLHLLKRELEILREVDHPNIASFYECYQDAENYHFVLEYCGGKTLVDHIIEMKKLPESEVKHIFF